MARRVFSGTTFIQRSRAVSSEEKAVYHNVLGAGRRGVLRPFLDLGTDDQEILRDTLEQRMAARIKRNA